jgi:hypothetical protein
MILGGHLGGHLGNTVSALLDDQLSPIEAERAWAHVHQCHECRDRVEREGWVKRRLSCAPTQGVSDSLKGALMAPGDLYLHDYHEARTRRTAAIAALGGGAVGAAVMGVLALGTAPAAAPTIRPVPVTSVSSVGQPITIANRLGR